MKKRRRNVILSYFCSFILALLVIASGMLLSVKLGFATSHSVMKAIDESGYSKLVEQELLHKCESLAIPNALGKEVFDGVFSQDKIDRDSKDYLKTALGGEAFFLDTKKESLLLTENINRYVEQKQLEADGNKDEIIGEFVASIMDCYETMVQVPYAAYVGNVFRAFSRCFLCFFPAMIVFSIALIVILYRLNRRKVNRVFRYMAYSFMSGAFSVLLIPVSCSLTSFYTKIMIYPESVYRFMVKYLENGLVIMGVIGAILFVLSLIMIGLSCYIKHCLKKGSPIETKKDTKKIQ